ncbi:MAG: hypothetical protein K2M00_02810 [Muribaculaceae bacterium]|nr:hypothetical protein [Muribaculaceae bacterium]
MAEITTAGADLSAPAENRWIAPEFAAVLQERGYIEDALTVAPADVADIDEVNVSGDPESGGSISSLRGIEHFKSLRSLDCSFNRIAAIDLSGNPLLAELYCHYNLLTELDLSANGRLATLVCSRNDISLLDVSRNPFLSELNCDRNRLAVLDLKCNLQLTGLVCDTNLLTALDISANRGLEVLVCIDNPGENGMFKVKSPFESASIPSDSFTTEPWEYGGSEVRIEYIKEL